MIKIKSSEIFFETKDALIHDAYIGFKEDYLCIHSLFRKHKPDTVLEIGTYIGNGVNVIARAVPTAKIYSLDLDYDTMRLNSKQYPIDVNGEDRVGSAVTVPYIQLRGDSLRFDYNSLMPIDAWYIDGEHDYIHVLHESTQAFLSRAKLIVWHDSDITDVYRGIVDASTDYDSYELYRVFDTRIAYAVKK